MHTASPRQLVVRHGNVEPVSSPSRLPWISLVVVYVLWGSTYLANRFVLPTVPPLLVGGYRFLVGGALLAGIVFCVAGRAAFRMTRAQFGTTALSGLLLPAWGNGMVVFAQQGVSSGLAALLIAAVPLWIVLLRALTGDRPRAATVGGVAVGVVGLAVLVFVGPASGGVQGTTWWGPWLVLLASLGWATGTFATTRLPVPANPFTLAALQMVTGGLILLAVGSALGERLDVTAVSASAWIAWVYLSVVVTLGAFSAYAFALASLPVSTVATYAYVNPVIAVALGAVVAGERFTGPQLVGAAVVLLAVVLVVSAERTSRKRRGAVAPSVA